MSAAPVDIIIPVYNEGGNVLPLLEGIGQAARFPCVVHLVYDFPEDDTLPAARTYRGPLEGKIRFMRNRGRGVAEALKTGLAETDGELAIVSMGDLSDPPEVMNQMVELAASGFDVVCASRYMKGGRQIGGPSLKVALSRAAGLSLHYFAGVPTTDATNNFKLYRRSFLRSAQIESVGGFEVGLELVLKAWAGGFRVADTPTVWRDRSAGESRFDLRRWLPKYLRWYLGAFGFRYAGRDI